MQKPMYPCKTIRITQKDHEGTHIACWAVDEAGIDGGISDGIMPFDGIVKRIYKADANEVWIESLNPVLYPDGTEDYMTIMFAHDNDVSNLYEGQILKQGERFYQEGTTPKKNVTGNHMHIECAKGKFVYPGWYKDSSGAWSIINGKKASDCLWIDDSYTIKDTRGYNFRKVMTTVGTPVARNEDVYQVKVFDTTTILNGRKSPNGEILGHINPGIYNILDRKADGDYDWFMVENNLWFAYNAEWCEYLPKKEIIVEPIPETTPIEPEVEEPSVKELQETIEGLDKEIARLEIEIAQQDEETLRLKEQLANAPKLIFESTKLDYYAIQLKENQKLYLG